MVMTIVICEEWLIQFQRVFKAKMLEIFRELEATGNELIAQTRQAGKKIVHQAKGGGDSGIW
jgi:hypothetical protein